MAPTVSMNEEEDLVEVEAIEEKRPSLVEGEDEEVEVEVEDAFASRRQELRDLRIRLVALRKSAKSADKKRKKGLQEEIIVLESLLETKKQTLAEDEQRAAGAALVMERTLEVERVTAARNKRQMKREAKLREEERQRDEAQTAAALMPQLGRLEREAFESILSAHQLDIHPIDPDGNCLFNALAHQLVLRHQRIHRQTELRTLAADYIEANAGRYAGFLEEPLDEYCRRIRDNDLWGGHLELDALARSLQLPIILYQADSLPMEFKIDDTEDDGADKEDNVFDRPATQTPLRICYQKFAYSLGEHYDSLVDREVSIE